MRAKGFYFKDGFKYFDSGHRIGPAGMKDFMSSNGSTIYTAVYWNDGSSSCNCPGWANRGTCDHSKKVLGFHGVQRIRHETEAERKARTEGLVLRIPEGGTTVRFFPDDSTTIIVQQPEPLTRVRRIKD